MTAFDFIDRHPFLTVVLVGLVLLAVVFMFYGLAALLTAVAAKRRVEFEGRTIDVTLRPGENAGQAVSRALDELRGGKPS